LQPRGAISTTSAHGRALKHSRARSSARCSIISTTSAHGRALKRRVDGGSAGPHPISTTSAHGRALKLAVSLAGWYAWRFQPHRLTVEH